MHLVLVRLNCWIVIYPVNSAIQLLNNSGQASSVKLDSVN